jgi:hypothetical protein
MYMWSETIVICRVGQNHMYTVYIRYYWQGNHQIYGNIRCIYTVLANPSYTIDLCLAGQHPVPCGEGIC